jgi:PncC family amidohydrolase
MAAITSLFPDALLHSAEALLTACRDKKITLASAESCTGGLLGGCLTDIPGISAIYAGGVISYSNALKQNLLKVPETLLRDKGAVCAEVAAAMAEGIRARTGTTLGLATTGIAGPEGGSEEKPVGLVYIAVAGPESTRTETLHLTGSRLTIRLQTVEKVLTLTHGVVMQLPAQILTDE